MSYRKRRSGGSTTLLILGFMIVGLVIPVLIFNVRVESPEREIYTEGFITEKNIEKGFGSAYIFVLNGTTDISVWRVQYESFVVGDYIRIYITLFGYEIIKVNV